MVSPPLAVTMLLLEHNYNQWLTKSGLQSRFLEIHSIIGRHNEPDVLVQIRKQN